MTESIFKPEECEVISFAPLSTIRDDGISRRILLETGGGKVVLFSLDAGQEIAEHANPNHVCIQVLTGSLNLVLAGQSRVLGPGELLHMPPEHMHALRANSPTSFLLTRMPAVTIS